MTTTFVCASCRAACDIDGAYTDPSGRGSICGLCTEHLSPRSWTKHTLTKHLFTHDRGYYLTSATTKADMIRDHQEMHHHREDNIMTDTTTVIDLSKPTGYFEVRVFHYASGGFSVDTDRGLGRCTVYETDNADKAIGVAEYLEQTRRISCDDTRETIVNDGPPFDGSVWHWDC